MAGCAQAHRVGVEGRRVEDRHHVRHEGPRERPPDVLQHERHLREGKFKGLAQKLAQ